MKLSKILNHVEQWLITLLLVTMTLLTFSQVVARYVFNSGTIWALEVTTYLFSLANLTRPHPMLLNVARILLLTARSIFFLRKIEKNNTFSISACMVFVIIMFIGSYEYISLLKAIEIKMGDLPILGWQAKIILPLSFALMFYRLLWKL
ncbi:C4-dicarboxylate transporter, DctQ subunit [Abyssogena phaseoliformis symbiont OG214]|nr:C4-dicarboxylate transporter, DctQ subunit [Abyssogena phaseoliformis symbiont OG214]